MHLFSRELARDVRMHICTMCFSDGGFAVLVAMDSSEAWGEAIPLTETAKRNLSASEVYECFPHQHYCYPTSYKYKQ